MPLDFPDMESLLRAAQIHKFRKPKEDETTAQFRNALADFVKPRDFIESEEIRNGIGWDKWDEGQRIALLGRAIESNIIPPLGLKVEP